jgi:hypothetical protein
MGEINEPRFLKCKLRNRANYRVACDDGQINQLGRTWRNIVSKKRRTEKTVEIHEFYAIRTASGSLPVLCPDCPTGDGIMLTPEHAAVLAHVPTRVIYRWVEAGSSHYSQSADGSLIVCVKSIVASLNKLKGTNQDFDL